MLKTLKIALALGLALGFFSCSRAEPKILYEMMEKVFFDGPERIEQRCTFFVLCEDEDGVENLSELYLYNDREGLRWLFTPEDWVVYNEDGRVWIGSRHVVMYADEPMPRGQYRTVLVNRGGERTERNFAFDIPEVSPHPFPSFSIDSGVFRLDSRYPVNRLLCYNEEGSVIETIPIPEAEEEGSINGLNLSQNVRSLALWAEDSEFRISAVTQAIAVR